jgi:hypothetical protein
MDNVLIPLNNIDQNKVVYVNVAGIVWITDDGTGNLLVGLSDGTRFHMKQKLRDLPPQFTNLVR